MEFQPDPETQRQQVGVGEYFDLGHDDDDDDDDRGVIFIIGDDSWAAQRGRRSEMWLDCCPAAVESL